MDKNKARPENYESNITTRNTPDSTSGIYLATAKVPQHSMVNDNTRENKEAKNETENKTAAWRVCLQQNRSKAFQKYQDCMDNILSPFE